MLGFFLWETCEKNQCRSRGDERVKFKPSSFFMTTYIKTRKCVRETYKLLHYIIFCNIITLFHPLQISLHATEKNIEG